MPYYEYKCSNECQEVIEVKMGIKDAHPPHLLKPCTCPGQGYTYCEFRRLVSRTGIVLQGQGWARDGYT